MLVYVFGFQVINRQRCVVAARHAAWIRGNGQGQLLDRQDVRARLASNFFNQTVVVGFETTSKRYFDALSPTGTVVTMNGVTFGMTQGELASASPENIPFPLSLIRVKLPIVGEAFSNELVDSISLMRAECAWYDVGDSWEGWGSLVKGAPLIGMQILYNLIQDTVQNMITWII